MFQECVNISEFVGKTFSFVTKRDDELIIFKTVDGVEYWMGHQQDCCEHVYIDDICGELYDLIDSPILIAEERSNSDNPKNAEYDESFKWTFYEIATNKGSVTIKWYGSSNGYYSESVDVYKLVEKIKEEDY